LVAKSEIIEGILIDDYFACSDIIVAQQQPQMPLPLHSQVGS
jgi:hypothetical protein